MRNWIILAILLFIITALAGCAAPQVPVNPLPIVQPDREVVIPKRELLDDCPDLQILVVRPYTQGEVVKDIVAPIIKAYKVCAARHHELAAITAKAFNIDMSIK